MGTLALWTGPGGGAREQQAGAGQVAEFAFELEPIVITAPRLKIPETMIIDPRINIHLLELLERASKRSPDARAGFDAPVEGLNELTTLTGYKLKVRYRELGFLLTEGLVGVNDYQLTRALDRVASGDGNPQTRAAAMVALGYTKDTEHLPLFQQGMQDPNVTVRFGALESMLLLGGPDVESHLTMASRADFSKAVQVLAAAGAWKMGDRSRRQVLVDLSRDLHWFVRAMAVRYLGEHGGQDDYDNLMRQLETEEDLIVKAELCLALLRLQKHRN